MSECVVRMEMPKSCWDCPCFDDYGDYPRCEITNEQRGYNFPIHEKRMPNCPIIYQLPEGHGPLKDADALIKRIETHKAVIEACTAEAMTETGKNIGTGAVKAFQISLLAINEIPTTVPAEAERSEI